MTALRFSESCTLLQVFDMLESVQFYRDLLGFEIVAQAPWFEAPYRHFNWGLLKNGNAQLMLNTAYEAPERPAVRDSLRMAAHFDTTIYIGCADVDSAYEFLRTAGISLAPPVVQRYGMKEIAFPDPDGYGICLQGPV